MSSNTTPQAPNPFVPGANFHGGIFYQYGGNNQNITTPQDHPVTQTNTTYYGSASTSTPTSSASSSEPTTPATASSSTALAAGPAASPPVSTAGTAPAGRWAEQGKRGGRRS
ncbi:hypothetical protein BKA70DRAFT_1428289 [Coprinopsis sp. MPI-PUGE-AT-0042]|nr:hypothetical protein BKA70DRAFT_1428289 [Coprinopsis sp. MPI-PUGE-AT-0042]